MHSTRWEIKRIFFLVVEIMDSENIRCYNNKDYYSAIRLKIITYKLMIISNMELGNNRRKMMKILSC